MNEKTISRSQIDRMVDGELELDQQRQLLLSCEEHPPFWRDLALAYVETQTFDRELKRLAAEPVAGPSNQRRVQRAWWQSMPRPLALAAAVLLSLGVGYVGGLWYRGFRVDSLWVAELRQPSRGDELQIPEASSVVGTSAPSIQLTVADSANNEFRQIDVPVVAASELGPEWMEQMPRAVPAEVLRSMQQLGHEVRQNGRLIPMRLRDGRRMVVPYREIEVTYVGYQ